MNEVELDIFQYIFNNPFIGICVTDDKGKCLFVNEAQTRLTGVPKSKFVGQNLRQLVNKNVLSNSSTLEVLKSRNEVTLHQVTAGGGMYDVRGVPIFDNDGKIKYVISYLLDVTDLVKFKNQISNLKADKAKSEDRIKNLLLSKKREGEILFCSKQMEEIITMAKKIAVSDATVLIVGPSGSGKELIADLIHKNSKRRDGPFVKINCAAIPEQLLESELFGYEPGAFTGGNQKGSKGLFETANGGSLLLDEIGEMPLFLQAKMLRVLQDQVIRRVGGTQSITVDVRIIASTNASLKTLIERRSFREDLYFRLNVISINVPGLDERKEDIPMLADHFIIKFNKKYGVKKYMQTEAMQYLISRDYPGNIRELQNIIERIILQSPNDEIALSDAYEICDSLKIRHEMNGKVTDIEISDNGSLKDIMASFERDVIKEYLRIYKNPDMAAKKLKIDRSTISRKMHKFKLI